MDQLFWFSASWTGATCLVVLAILGSFIILYRHRQGRAAFYTHGNNKTALTLTLSLAALVFVALDLNFAYHDHKVWVSLFGQPPRSEDSIRIQVRPEQYAWNFCYAGTDGVFGTLDDILTINEMHVPVGKPVIVQMTSKDVIHSFFLPNLRIKQDVVPGMRTSLYFLPEQMGRFNIACAEHCGLGHYRMKGQFIVETEEEFQAWLTQLAQEPSASSWGWDWTQRSAKI
ncbi:MAG: Alternative cytochrome c oxidase subunit 2 [Elusimicrobia bacterium]|nr:Alternative cytochrome c oxidase subunit 2 [Elusimicrobiota bacterium]